MTESNTENKFLTQEEIKKVIPYRKKIKHLKEEN